MNKWTYLVILSIVWGSSFILMKRALIGLTALEVGIFRIVFTGLFLFGIAFKTMKKIKKKQWKYVVISAFLGTFFPAFFFALAIREIDSSIPAILNSLTPLNTLITGFLFFGFSFRPKAIYGVLLGLLGTLYLILKGASISPNQNYFYALFVLVSSIGYAVNVNIIKKYLQDLDPKAITTGSFAVIFLPTLVVLGFSDFFQKDFTDPEMYFSLGYLVILAILGTAVAKIIFNKLVQISSPVFASSVTYLIPIVALGWAMLDGEKFSLEQALAALLILVGVYLTNRANRSLN